MSWLRDIASADGVDLEEAAAYALEAGVVISAECWALLDRGERVALISARRAMIESVRGQRESDHARAMAATAAMGVAERLRRQASSG